jgi:hypothetical protein
LNVSFAEDDLLAALVELIQDLGHFPATANLMLRRTADPSVPSHNVYARLGNRSELASRVLRHCGEEPSFEEVRAICAPIAARAARGPDQMVMMRSERLVELDPGGTRRRPSQSGRRTLLQGRVSRDHVSHQLGRQGHGSHQSDRADQRAHDFNRYELTGGDITEAPACLCEHEQQRQRRAGVGEHKRLPP